MSQRRTTWASLHEELRNIDVLDRIHDYATEADPPHERAYAIRQRRRKQIMDEIIQLRAVEFKKGKSTWVSRALVFACAVGYAMLYYLLR